MTDTLRQAFKNAIAAIHKLSDKEFYEALEKHKNGDVAIAIQELAEFANEKPCCQINITDATKRPER